MCLFAASMHMHRFESALFIVLQRRGRGSWAPLVLLDRVAWWSCFVLPLISFQPQTIFLVKKQSSFCGRFSFHCPRANRATVQRDLNNKFEGKCMVENWRGVVAIWWRYSFAQRETRTEHARNNESWSDYEECWLLPRDTLRLSILARKRERTQQKEMGKVDWKTRLFGKKLQDQELWWTKLSGE